MLIFMKKLIVIFTFIAVHYLANAQSDEEYANSIKQYQELVAKKDYAGAIPYVKKAASIVKLKAGEKELNYATLINTTGTLFFFLSKYDSAIYYYNQTLSLYNSYHASNKKEILQTHQNIGLSYYRNSDFSNARKWYELIVAEEKEMYGENNDNYRISLGTLANIYKALTLYDKAEEIMINNIEYYKKFKPNTESHELALENLAALYDKFGFPYWAGIFYWRASEIRLLAKGKTDDYYNKYLINATRFFELAGNQYREEGDYEKAEECYGFSSSIFLKQKNNKEYARFMNLQGLMMLELSNYTSAEINFFTALAIFKKEFSNTHLAVGMVSNNIGSLYMSLNMFDLAEHYYTEGYTIRKKNLQETHQDLAESCSNLGEVYSSKKQYDKAEEFYLKAISIYEKGIGTSNTYYAVVINNLATLYLKQKKYVEAEKYYFESLSLREKLQGKNHPSYARVLNNLGVLYLNWGNSVKAKGYLVNAVTIIQNKFGKNNQRNITYLNNLALCNNNLGNFEEAKKQILESNNLISEKTKQNFTILTESEKESYADEMLYNAKFANSILHNSKSYNKENLIDNFNQQLQLKALVLNETKSLYEFIQNSKDSSFNILYNRYAYLKELIAKEYGLATADRLKELPDWELEVTVVEKELLLKSRNFQQQKSAINVSFNEVKNNLADDEVAIEFVKFNLYNKGETDSTLYVAYIISKKQDAPIYVPLFEKRELQKLLDSAGNTNQSMVLKLYRSSLLSKKSSNANFGQSLYNLIWQPLEPYLKGITTVHYAPVDKLNSIAFNALAIDSGVYLIDKYKLYQHTSTRSLSIKNPVSNGQKNIVLFGDANFSLDPATITAYEKAADTAVVKRGFDKGQVKTNAWSQLPGTAEEIKKIQQLFSTNKLSTFVFSGANATEDNFKKLNNQSNTIIHIATHGFFLERIDNEQQNLEANNTTSYNTAYDPMLRSGIVLGGANYAWNQGFVPKGKQDGIVTAFEISQLNLTKTDLVVLSACETALGDIQGSEGVYGLQRAFKLAGVKNLIVSLWQVPDKETAELMNNFYQHYLDGISIREAFYKAQQTMRKKYSPYYWAAFNLVD